MQYYNQREKTLKRIIKITIIILVTILCITGIYFLVNMNKREQNALSISEQQEQQRMLTLRPLYEQKSKLESQLSNITSKRNYTAGRSPVIIPLLTDCSEGTVRDFSSILQQYNYPAVICVSDTSFPGASGCISVEEAKELVKRRWEFMIDISSDIDELTEYLISSGLTKPVAIYDPAKDNDSRNVTISLPVVYYGNQSDKTLLNAVYGMQAEELFYVAETALNNRKAFIVTCGTVLSREIYDKSRLLEILSYKDIMGAGLNVQICTYSENVALQAQYNQQQQKVIDETEVEYQSISEALRNIEVQIEKIETDLLN